MTDLQDNNQITSTLGSRVAKLPIDAIKKALYKDGSRRRGAQKALLDGLGLETIGELIADGAMLSQIARSLDVSNRAISGWVRDHPQHANIIPAAYEAAADLYVTLANQELDDACLDKDSIALARTRSAHYMKLAAHFDQARYGAAVKAEEDTGGGVTYNIVIGGSDAISPVLDAIEGST